MVYGGGGRARALLRPRPRTRSAPRFLDDLDRPVPAGAARTSPRRWCKKWEHAGPFAAPGRWRGQAALERGLADRIFFAGDWISEFVSMETAALTAVDAAAAVRRVVA